MALLDPQHSRRRMRDAVAHAAAAPSRAIAATRLAPLFADIGWLKTLTEDFVALLQEHGTAAPSLPTARNGASLTVTLESAPPVRLMLHLIEGMAERPDAGLADIAPTIGFSGTHGLYHLLSSHPVEAMFGSMTPEGGRCRTRPVRIRSGQWLSIDESRRALRILPQERPVLMLRARIEVRPAPPIRQYAVEGGALISTVQGDDGFARSAMLLSVLRVLGHRNATPTMIGLLDRATGRERWTVMRELLALDAQAAWPHLVSMAANDPDPAVRAAAGSALSLRQQPIEEEAQPCLA